MTCGGATRSYFSTASAPAAISDQAQQGELARARALATPAPAMSGAGGAEAGATMQAANTVGQMWNPSLYIGSILSDPQDRVSILPPRIKDSMPSPEPKPGDKGWLYRVLEPYYSRECVDNVTQAMLSGQISSGAAWPRRLADQICSLYNVPVALPTSSGASALHVALLACDLGPQDHVLVPSFTMVAVANMVKLVGAKPVYCDCAPGSLNPGKEELLRKATPRTKAVILCHTYGVACKDGGVGRTGAGFARRAPLQAIVKPSPQAFSH